VGLYKLLPWLSSAWFQQPPLNLSSKKPVSGLARFQSPSNLSIEKTGFEPLLSNAPCTATSGKIPKSNTSSDALCLQWSERHRQGCRLSLPGGVIFGYKVDLHTGRRQVMS
jgi:hypothetical protein